MVHETEYSGFRGPSAVARGVCTAITNIHILRNLVTVASGYRGFWTGIQR
jgi:hypothetical protein